MTALPNPSDLTRLTFKIVYVLRGPDLQVYGRSWGNLRTNPRSSGRLSSYGQPD